MGTIFSAPMLAGASTAIIDHSNHAINNSSHGHRRHHLRHSSTSSACSTRSVCTFESLRETVSRLVCGMDRGIVCGIVYAAVCGAQALTKPAMRSTAMAYGGVSK